MTIKTIYKVEGDSNEYDSEQKAQVAEAIGEAEGLYLGARDTQKVAEAITKKYFLTPILITTTIEELYKEAEAKEKAEAEAGKEVA